MLLGPLCSPNKRRGSDWRTPIGFSHCISAQSSLFSGAALGNTNLACFAEQMHHHYLNWPSGGKVDHVCCLHKTAPEKTLDIIRHDQLGKGNLRQGGGKESGPKHQVGRVISRTEGELTFQHNQRSEEYYFSGASKKAEKLKATDRTRQAEQSCALVVTNHRPSTASFKVEKNSSRWQNCLNPQEEHSEHRT